jgi:hypothetical protein
MHHFVPRTVEVGLVGIVLPETPPFHLLRWFWTDGPQPSLHAMTEEVRVILDRQGRAGVFTSTSSRCLDGGDVDLLHRHHRFEGAFSLIAAGRKRIG